MFRSVKSLFVFHLNVRKIKRVLWKTKEEKIKKETGGRKTNNYNFNYLILKKS